MRFLLDANLPVRLGVVFLAAGHECEHMEVLLPRYTGDPQIARLASSLGAALVSRDADFVRLSREGVLQTPLIWIRLGNMRGKEIAATLAAELPKIVAAIEAGQNLIEIQ